MLRQSDDHSHDDLFSLLPNELTSGMLSSLSILDLFSVRQTSAHFRNHADFILSDPLYVLTQLSKEHRTYHGIASVINLQNTTYYKSLKTTIKEATDPYEIVCYALLCDNILNLDIDALQNAVSTIKEMITIGKANSCITPLLANVEAMITIISTPTPDVISSVLIERYVDPERHIYINLSGITLSKIPKIPPIKDLYDEIRILDNINDIPHSPQNRVLYLIQLSNLDIMVYSPSTFKSEPKMVNKFIGRNLNETIEKMLLKKNNPARPAIISKHDCNDDDDDKAFFKILSCCEEIIIDMTFNILDEVNLANAHISNVTLKGFKGTNLEAATFNNVNIYDTDLNLVNIRRSDLRGVTINYLFSKNCLPNGTTLSGKDLRGVNWSGSNLQIFELQGANLEGANLEGCHLINTRLMDANLAKSNLCGADFETTLLYRTILTGARLIDLSGLSSSDSNVKQALRERLDDLFSRTSNAYTTPLPNGEDPLLMAIAKDIANQAKIIATSDKNLALTLLDIACHHRISNKNYSYFTSLFTFFMNENKTNFTPYQRVLSEMSDEIRNASPIEQQKPSTYPKTQY